MFVDKEWKNKQQHSDSYKRGEERLSPNNILFVALGLLLIAVFAGSVAVLFFERPIFNKVSPTRPVKEAPKEIAATSSPSLPGDIGDENGNGDGANFGQSDLKAEDLTFGYFYKKREDDFKPSFGVYTLPINVKTDVLNYYDVSRKLNLDPYLDDLNTKGFSMLGDHLPADTNDFFEAYRYLLENDIPIFITNDFIFYYFQNTLKQAFKEIEKNAFYENIWNINKSLFDKSLIRYRQRLDAIGEINDPVLEAERLEAAYFAVALKLLMPEESQINRKTDFVDFTKFNTQEADLFSYKIPNFLESDVEKEVKLIRAAASEVKSPTLLYSISYNNFLVPDNYKGNAKLNNFYLATKWLNSVFPLHYKSADCPDCLLDHDDWVINMAAAGLIAKDLHEDQELKNQWAVIYKIVNFFNGLRSDLTYLHYHGAMSELFGESYDVENIFGLNNKNREKDLKSIQDKILEFNFLDIVGGVNRNEKSLKPQIGMRMLQESFWPNDYLLKNLTGEDLSYRSNVLPKENPITFCGSKKNINNHRCRGFGLDVINLLNPIGDDYDYFNINTNYNNYDAKFNLIKKQVDLFNVDTWNNNVYWMTLDVSKKLSAYQKENMPVFMKEKTWEQKKDYNSILGSWVNLHLDADILGIYEGNDNGGGLGMGQGCNFYNYVEPNINFVQELIAKNNMLIDMFAALKITKKTNTASIELREVNGKFEQLISIMKKELSGEKINDDDCAFVEDFSKHYVVSASGNKNFSINFKNGVLNESINGVKPISVVYRNGDDKIMAVGPIFNYAEK